MYDNRQTAISCKNSIPTTLSANFIEVPFMYESLNDRILPDFFKSMEDLLLKEREEIPSFTRIYQKEKLICETFNEVEKNSDSSFHSEILCIRNAKKKLKTRYLTDCALITSLEPCLMCAGTILLSRIPKVIYLLPARQGEGISSLSIETIYSRNFFPELICIPAEISKNAFKSFFKIRRKKFN
ncbi:cytidine and deoxycytidylate deaminase zinc-binding region [Leptospira santarosai str. 200702252]|nr:cytidine and deoxycytidylate deaminase zinc-binding region [Leptospira santarosai str. 200403458]EMO98967.1 cytidine and deoxycytidylate deaminase zinc-binding region [Leptospira santarosai str. 200702252]